MESESELRGSGSRVGAQRRPNKAYDLSPIDQQSFDPTTPPPLAIFPINSAPPVITPLDTLEVGHQLLASVGSWTPAGMTYLRQWFRGDMPIVGAAGAAYDARRRGCRLDDRLQRAGDQLGRLGERQCRARRANYRGGLIARRAL